MNPLETLVGALAGAGGRPGGGSPDLAALAGGLLGQDGAGLGQLVERLQQGGLGEQARSWVSSGENLPVSGAQLESALGSDGIAALARQMGLEGMGSAAAAGGGSAPTGAGGGLGDLLGDLLGGGAAPGGAAPPTGGAGGAGGLGGLGDLLGGALGGGGVPAAGAAPGALPGGGGGGLAGILAMVLPLLVDRLTPGGRMPQPGAGGGIDLGALLGGLTQR